MNRPLVTYIQKYSIHDGKGIRTTVFFKGCPLSCTWCHNPETQAFEKELLVNTEKCTGCGACVVICPRGAVSLQGGRAVTDRKICGCCKSCTDCCPVNIRELSGRYYTVEDLVCEIDKDRIFYEQSEGGVTLSGGEVLAQDMDYIEELAAKLYKKGYRVNIDTSGYGPFAGIKRILPYVDTFLYDIKVMDTELHRRFTGAGNERILENLKLLSQEKASIWIRIPVIGGVNASVCHMERIAEFLKKERIALKQINLLPYHNTGSSKYTQLQRNYEGSDYKTPDERETAEFAAVFQSYGFLNTKIGG